MKNHMRRAAEKFDLFSIPSLIKCGFKYFFKRLFFQIVIFLHVLSFGKHNKSQKLFCPLTFACKTFFTSVLTSSLQNVFSLF